MSQNGTNDSKDLKHPSETTPLKPPQRRLVVMFDGTGNTRQSMTNVSRMFEAIDDSLPDLYKPIEDSKDSEDSEDCPPVQERHAYTKAVQCKICNQSTMNPAKHEGDDSKANFRAGVPCKSCNQLVVEPKLEPVQLVKYITGVGTSFKGVIAWLTAQTLGFGLSEKIKEGYTWLCENYQKDDEVFVFGFSRGAFAARSLVSMLYKCCGVLQIPDDHAKAIKTANTAFNYYERCDPEYVKITGNESIAAKQKRFALFKNYLADEKVYIEPLHVQVKMLGVWDTVGALGFKTGWWVIDSCWIGRDWYQFHNQDLSCIVDNAYHALALDEAREAFNPTLWTTRDPQNQEVKQVWFVGSHCNVGGGADLDDIIDPDDLWQYSYVWMQRHAEKHGLRFYWSFDSPPTQQVKPTKSGYFEGYLRTRRVSLRKTEPSLDKFLHGIYKGFKQVTSGTPFIREAKPDLAMLHWSVLERIKVTRENLETAKKNKLMNVMEDVYRPKTLYGKEKNLAAIIPKGSPEVVALLQADANGGVEPPIWHIESDDVMANMKWALPKEKEDMKKA